jgi:sugar lactone lactonase YvrE
MFANDSVSIAVSAPEVLSDTRDRVGECPVWSVNEQALYWVDIEGQRLHRYDWASQTQQTWRSPERIGCMALAERSGAPAIVAAMESGIFELQLLTAPTMAIKLIAPMQHRMPNMRFNDGRCDAQGRFWVSTMCMDMGLGATVGGIYCLDKTNLSAVKVDGLITPNGMAFSPDGAVFYLSDSHPSVQKIWTFDFEAATATLSARRDFVDMNLFPGRPDGAAVDTKACYWICGNDAGQIHRFSPTGELLQSLTVPVSKPSMCCFGGPDLDHLFVTSILPADVQATQVGLNGAVFMMKVGVQGLAEPIFSC